MTEKDILFGIVHRGAKVELIINFDDPQLPQILMGALSFIAATDKNFYADLKRVIQNVDENGDKIRKAVAMYRASGALAFVSKNKLQS